MPELLSGEGASALTRVLPHLADGCAECRTVLQRLLDLQERWGYWDAAVLVQEPPFVEDHLEALLAPASFEEKTALLHKESDLPTWCLCTRLLELSREAVDEEEGLTLALLGLRAVELLSPVYDASYVADLRVRLLSQAAALFIRLGEPHAALDYLSRASTLLEAGTGDPQIAAELLSARHPVS